MTKYISITVLVLIFFSCQKDNAVQTIPISKFPGRIDAAKIFNTKTKKLLAYATNDSIILKELRNNVLYDVKRVNQKCKTPNCLNNILIENSENISFLSDKIILKEKSKIDLLLPIQYSDSIYFGLKRDCETKSILCAVDKSGSVLWSTKMNSDDLQFIDNSNYYLHKNLLAIKNLKKQILLFNALTGNYIRKFDFQGDFFDFVYKNHFVFKDKGKLLFYSINDKKSIIPISIAESNFTSIHEYNNHLYVLSTMNKLYQIDQNLETINEMDLNEKIDNKLIVFDFMIENNHIFILGHISGKTPFAIFKFEITNPKK